MSEPALLAAIAASPDDDLLRLVYADWLDMNGQPLRAEFIRLQIEIARKETLPRAVVNVFSHLWKRQQEILDDHRDELLGTLADWSEDIRPFEFRRGFLSELNCTARDFEWLGPLVTALTPLPDKIAVRHVCNCFVDFCDLNPSWLEAITHLQISSGNYQDARQLTGAADVTLIRSACGWAQLRSLDMENCGYGDIGIANLFAPPCIPALQDLDLSFNNLTDAGVIALLNTGVPQRLKRLVLGGNPIGDQAAIEAE